MWDCGLLTPDPDKEPDQLVSSPHHWPLMRRGLRMCGWGDNEIKFFLIGNPLIWWGSTLSILVLVVTFLVYIIRWKRGFHDFSAWGNNETFNNNFVV